MERAYFAVAPAHVPDLWSCTECGAVVSGAGGQMIHDAWHARLAGG